MGTESRFDRSKMKNRTSADELKASDKVLEDTVNTGQKGNYAGFLKIEGGKNVFLVYPSHEMIQQGLSEFADVEVKPKSFIQPKQQWWLPREVDDKDQQGNVIKDKKGNPVKKIINLPVYDARVHSSVKKDIVQTYIDFVKKNLEEEYGTGKDAEKIVLDKMLPIYGRWTDNPSTRVASIIGKPSWIMYVKKVIGEERVFGRIEVGKAIKMRINELCSVEDSDDPISTEVNNPFIDLDDRRALVIKYNKDSKDPKLIYITEIDSSYDKETKQLNFYPLTDDEIEEFLKFPPLSKLYENPYTQKDFDNALEGLEIFDEQQEYGIFANQEFLDKAEELRELYPEAEAESDDSTNDDPNVDIFEHMTRDEMKTYARENKTGIVVTPRTFPTDDDLKAALRTWYKEHHPEENNEPGEAGIDSTDDKSDIEKILDETPAHLKNKNEKGTGKSATDKINKVKKNVADKK